MTSLEILEKQFQDLKVKAAKIERASVLEESMVEPDSLEHGELTIRYMKAMLALAEEAVAIKRLMKTLIKH